ncbi:hypothetical protein [Ferrovibrio sp.]|uniref:hypothetical protein n=1 Tax=Ferrovibrio sp. TaxID=1917215 RepID=UPI003D141E9D
MRFTPPPSETRLSQPGPMPRMQGDSGLARGLAAAGEQLAQTARVMEHEAEQQAQKAAQVEAARIYSEARVATHQSLLDAQRDAPADGAGFVEGRRQALTADLKQRLEGASERARPLVAVRFADLEADYLEKAQGFAAGLNLARQSEDLARVMNLSANRVRVAPGEVVDALATAEEAIDGSSLSPAAKEKAKKLYGDAIARAALQGLNEQDPAQAQQWLREGFLDRHLTPDAKHALVNDNEGELRRRDAQAKAEAAQRRAEERQRLMDLRLDLADRIRDEEVASAEGRTTGLKLSEVRAAYPDRPDVVERFEKKINTNLATAAARAELMAAPLGEEQSIIDRFTPAGDNYANTAAARDRLLNLQAQKHQAINRDSAEFALAISPGLKAQRAKAFETGQAADLARYMRGLEEQQGALGLPPHQRMVLAKNDAAAIVERVNNAATPDAKLALLQAVTSGNGDEALGRRAYAALIEAKLPEPLQYALEVGNDPARLPTARRLLTELSSAPAKVNLTDADLKTVVQQADRAYRDGIGGVLSRAYALTGNAGFADRQQQDAKVLQHVTRTRTAAGLDDAAGSAYADLFGHLKPLQLDRLAAVLLPGDADAAAVERGLLALRNQAADALAVAERPKDKAAALVFERSTLADFRRAASFINAGEGFVLLRPGSGKAVAGADGQPRLFTLSEILAAGQVQAARDERPVLGMPTP